MTPAAAPDLRTPTPAQRRAAAPDAAAWVTASAGTGKTEVLIDRILNLLLAGARPQRLLCLTFTKAAAQEMTLRLTRTLRRWATAPDDRLRAELEVLTGAAPGAERQARERRLFADVLEAPGGLRVDTIHAFCQSMLRRFPLESGLPPDFHVLDERSARELLQDCLYELLAAVRAKPDGILAASLRAVGVRAGEDGLADILGKLTSERGRLRRLVGQRGGDRQAIDRLYRSLGLKPGTAEHDVVTRACDDASFDVAGLRNAARAMLEGSVRDKDRGRIIADWLAAPEKRADSFGSYLRAYFKAEGERFEHIATKKTLEENPGLQEVLSVEAVRLHQVRNDRNAARIAGDTAALIRLGADLVERYSRAKLDRSAVDYDDLILAACELLRPENAPWVLYRLDGGIDHVLVDESQDTNPEQWQVIEAITREFFAGEGAGRPGRTLFSVGDAKQSIYSFQRADPQAYIAMREVFAGRAKDGGVAWRNEELIESFRSTAAVLDAVDAVFARPETANGVALDGRPIRHRTTRTGEGGTVELWPPVEPLRRAPVEPWTPPVARVAEESPQVRLARLIAVRIAGWIGRERLESEGRPVRAGDILILVQRRWMLVDLIVRELKRAGVAVAGVDRMVLADQLAVMDLIALGRFLLLPEDDLTLATVLKGPLFGFTEERLFELAHPRTGTLWAELRARAAENADFATAHGELAALLARIDFVRPYDLFAEILGRREGRRRIVERLGVDAHDPLDQFLAAALNFERDHVPALETFLHWIEIGREEIKRDAEGQVRDEVRVMTVHGAKGLQAPIVILPDTFRAPGGSGQKRKAEILWLTGGGPDLPLWSPRQALDDPATASVRARSVDAGEAEYRRLLYVAMTRARDRLYVCGYRGTHEPKESCWYRLIEAALSGLPGVQSFDFAGPGGDPSGKALRLSCAQTKKVAGAKPDRAPRGAKLPDWWARRHLPPDEPVPPRPLVPSLPEGEEPPVRAPLDAVDDTARFQRGRLVHRLLQTLPDLPPTARDAAARRFLALRTHRLDDAAQAAIRRETFAVLDHPDWAPLFGPDSLAETPVVGRIGARTISGQIDRLVVAADSVLILDYKTNRPPPLNPADVAPIYVRQMAAYRAALLAIYPGRRVRCALLWTDGPNLMELPGDLLDRHAP